MKYVKPVIIVIAVGWFLFVGTFLVWNFGPAFEVMGYKTKAAAKVAGYRAGSLGNARYRLLLDATEAYVASNDEATAAMKEGKALAPVPFLNAELKRTGAKYRVRSANGLEVDFYEIS